MTQITLPAVVVGGLLDGINPCAFSVLLSFVAVILSSVALTGGSPRVWRIGGIYVFGMFLTYLLLGLGLIGVIGVLVRTHLAVRVIGVVVVALGVWTVKDGLLPGVGPPLAMSKAAYGLVRKAMAWSGPWGALAAGGLVGLCAVPCSGAIYVGILALIAAAPLWTRLGWLLLYNLMFIAPLLALLALVANRRSLNRVAHWTVHRREATKVAMGGATVVLGFVILIMV